MKKKAYTRFAIVLTIAMILSSISISATEIQTEIDWESKVSTELLEVMSTKSETDLIPIYIWLNDIDHDIINTAMIKEKGMDPAVYENEARFNSEIVPQIENQIISRVGYEVAHASVETSEFVLDQNGAYHDDTMSIVDRAINAKENEYIMAKRSISKREHSSVTNEFVNKYINPDRKIIDIGKYVTRVIIEATKSEIKYYASLSIVNDLSLYVYDEDSNNLSIPLDQVQAGYNGTKGNSYNNGNGYKGTGIKIGVLEAGAGQYDHNSPHLSPITGTRLFFVNDAGNNSDGSGITASISDHATVVTSIIIGQPVTIGSTTYEGVVPLATVYQTPVTSQTNVIKAINNMVDRGVTVINYSGGRATGIDYNDYDRDIDSLIHETGITFIVAAGNDGTTTTNVASPGKALNAITVGNAETINSYFTSIASPYGMRASSSYTEAMYLPNKPDVVAPGTRIRVVKSTTGTDNFYYNNGEDSTGTSLAAPIVTGIVAQMQQAGSLSFSSWPALVKSVLVTGADPSKIRTSESSTPEANNTVIGDNLWDKSGAGFVNAERSVTIADNATRWNYSFIWKEGQESESSEKYFSAGQRLRICLTFEKTDNVLIDDINDFNDIDLELLDSNGNVVASSFTGVDNVVVIDYIIPESGYYTFKTSSYRYIQDDNLDYYYSWYAY